jgi:8-oxo-dGTP diphosphatase
VIVVAAALISNGRVLVARRSAPAELAGQWEFPGGKVEADESDAEALKRECDEELGISIDVHELLGVALVRAGVELRIYRAVLLNGAPHALQDHDELRWVVEDELDDLDWLAPDRPLLPAIQTALRQ